MFSRGQIKNEVLERLQKSATTKGMYTDEKLDAAVRECLAYIAANCFLEGQGWRTQIRHLDVPANAVAIPVPADVAMISDVRYLCGNVYIPLTYDARFGLSVPGDGLPAIQYPTSYKIVDNCFYFNPAIAGPLPKGIELEFTSFVDRIRNDAQFLPPEFNEAMYYWTIYETMSIVTNVVGKYSKEWGSQWNRWHDLMLNIISRRNLQSGAIREFRG